MIINTSDLKAKLKDFPLPDIDVKNPPTEMLRPLKQVAIVTKYPEGASDQFKNLIYFLVEQAVERIVGSEAGFSHNGPQVLTPTCNLKFEYTERRGRLIEKAYLPWVLFDIDNTIDLAIIEPDKDGTAVAAWKLTNVRPYSVEVIDHDGKDGSDPKVTIIARFSSDEAKVFGSLDEMTALLNERKSSGPINTQ